MFEANKKYVLVVPVLSWGKGTVVTPMLDKEDLVHGAVNAEKVMCNRLTNKVSGLFIHPDQVDPSPISDLMDPGR